MAGKLLDVTAHTTLAHVEAVARGPDWRETGTGVLDVRTPRDEPDAVVLAFERDPTTVQRGEHHADELRLTRGQAEDLAVALATAADSNGADRPSRIQR